MSAARRVLTLFVGMAHAMAKVLARDAFRCSRPNTHRVMGLSPRPVQAPPPLGGRKTSKGTTRHPAETNPHLSALRSFC